MKKLTLFLLLLIASRCSAQGTAPDRSNPLGGDIRAQSTACGIISSCVWQKLPVNATTLTVTVSNGPIGAFSATLQFEQSSDGINFTAASPASTTIVGTFTFTVTSFTDFRVRASVYTSGDAAVNILSAGPSTGPPGPQGPAGTGSGSSSPSSLTTFFTLVGLSPTDCSTASCNTPGVGAKGDGKFYFDGNITATLAVLTAPTTTPFCNGSTVPCNGKNSSVGMIVEIQGAGAAGAVLHTTIASVTNSGTATLAATAGTTVTNKQVLMGDDDCTPLTNWGNNIATAFGPHNGYLPGQVLNGSVTGQFLTSCPVRVVNANVSGTNSGECAAVSGPSTAANLGCPLIIQGAGPGMSDIVPLTAGQFNWGSVDTGVLFIKGWATGYTISQIGIIADQSAHNTTAIATQIYGCFVAESSSHGQVMQNWFTGCKNTSNNNSAMKTVGDFESLYQNNALEASNYGLWLDNLVGQCPAGPSDNAGTCNKIHIYTNNLENNIIGVEIGSQLNTGKWQQIRLYDDHILSASFSAIQMTNNVTMAAKEGVLVDAVRINGGGASDLGISIQANGVGRFDISNSYLDNQLGGTLLSCISSNGDMNLSNTTLNANVNAVNITTCPFMHFMNGSITGTVTGANAAKFFSFQNTAIGWSGHGVNEGDTWIADQGVAQTSGNIALSANWGTSPTVTAVAGFAQNHRFTVTAQATTGANPTITDTLPNALPTANTICTARVEGGTGTVTSITQTTPSATAPVFTFNGTPTAGQTYIIDVMCGP